MITNPILELIGAGAGGELGYVPGSSLYAYATKRGDQSGDDTMASDTFSDIPDASVSITPTKASRLIIGFTGVTWSTNGFGEARTRYVIDGTAYSWNSSGITSNNDAGGGIPHNMAWVALSDEVTQAAHTVKIQWRRTAGNTVAIRNNSSNTWHLWVAESP